MGGGQRITNVVTAAGERERASPCRVGAAFGRCADRKYLLSDVTRIISDAGANIVSCATRTAAHMVEETFRIDVHNTRQLQRMVKKLLDVEGVTEVQRVDETAAPEPVG